MGSRIDITRVVDSFSSHTQMRPRTQGCRTSTETAALRDRLIAAAVEVIAEGSVPRLVQSRVRL
jgi:hypothetical protein